MKLGSLYQRAFRRLEPDDGKLSCPVLRGRRRWTHLLCYPTVILLLLSPLMASVNVNHVLQEIQSVQPSVEDLKRACEFKAQEDSFIKQRRADLLHDVPQEVDFFVFVSTSMHPDHLLEIGKEAQRYGGVLVLRGLVQDSFKETLKELSFLFKKEVSVLIDPQLFEDHKIRQVPTFVLTDATRWDRMTGGVSPKYALESFADSGDLSRDAQRRLNP